jgi:hypothetical protein
MHRAGVAGFVLLLATACGGTPFPGRAAATARPSTSTTVSPEIKARYARRFPAPPKGFFPVSQSAPGDGALTVESISARAQNASASRSLLSISGFLDGFARDWVTTNFLKGYSIRIYRFADTDGAQLYLKADIAGTAHQLAGGSVSAADLKPDSPTIIEAPQVDKYKNWVQVTLVAQDNYVLGVRYFSRAPGSAADAILAVTRAAVSRLRAGGD